MLPPLLRLDPDRPILIEQLRLLLGNVGASVIPTIVLTAVLVATLRTEGNAVGLSVWAAVVIGSKLLNAAHARQTLRRGITPDGARPLAWALTGLNALDGLAWGALPWVTLTDASVGGKVLVIAVLAGVTSNAMSVLAPVLRVFLAFSLCAVTVLALKLALMPEPEFQVLAYVSVLYVLTNVAQGRIAAQAALAAINLRVENVELIRRLRAETDKAQVAHQAAEQANLAKSRFLAAASHDLRQPIHALGLFLQVIGKGSLSDTQRTMLDHARATAKASSEMLNTLLDFSRIEAGVVEPQFQPLRLQPVLDKIESELAPVAVAKGLVFRTRECPAWVFSDPVLLELILRNLVSNAIRYTETGGILVGCRPRGQQVSVEVWDTGLGIEPSQQQAIFREFHQLGNPERDRNKGLGLGLAIVDGLRKVLNCELSLCSRPGRGSVFRLAIPVSAESEPTERRALARAPAQPLGLRVLVIDDDATIRTGMVELLHTWGCTCDAVENIEEALAVAARHPPDLVISDYRLREQRTGTEAIALLRSAIGPTLPALLVTGDTDPVRLREAQASQIPLLHKPVNPEGLYQKIFHIVTP